MKQQVVLLSHPDEYCHHLFEYCEYRILLSVHVDITQKTFLLDMNQVFNMELY